ncbi:hypothetical protein ACS0TY_034155 [Phlomoides rotata]
MSKLIRILCTSDWLKAEEMNFYKETTDDDLELYKEIEEMEKGFEMNILNLKKSS